MWWAFCMKKYLTILFLIVFITPSIAYASWWNPFSWKVFNKSPEVKIEKTVVTQNPNSVSTSSKRTKQVLKPVYVSPTITQKEDINLKIAKCQSSRDIKVLNIENEVDKQLAVSLNDLGLLKQIGDYLSDINNLEIQRKSLLKQQLLSPPGKYAPGGDVSSLGAEGALSALKNSGSEFEPAIQSIERDIIEKKNYLVFLDKTVAGLRPEVINMLKNTYLDEYNKCLSK